MAKEGLFVGLIPDGGRRAVDHDLALYARSYENGGEVVGDILKLMVRDERVRIFTVWGLSDDNAKKRSPFELDILNQIFKKFLGRLRHDLETPEYERVGVVHMGNPQFIRPDVMEMVDDITSLTKSRREKIFGLCLGYGSEDEMLRAEQVSRERWVAGEKTVTLFDCLDLPYRGGIPFQPADLIVRTGTDPLDPYTSGYLLPYQVRGKTRERYFSAFLPDFDPQTVVKTIDGIHGVAQRLGQ